MDIEKKEKKTYFIILQFIQLFCTFLLILCFYIAGKKIGSISKDYYKDYYDSLVFDKKEQYDTDSDTNYISFFEEGISGLFVDSSYPANEGSYISYYNDYTITYTDEAEFDEIEFYSAIYFHVYDGLTFDIIEYEYNYVFNLNYFYSIKDLLEIEFFTYLYHDNYVPTTTGPFFAIELSFTYYDLIYNANRTIDLSHNFNINAYDLGFHGIIVYRTFNNSNYNIFNFKNFYDGTYDLGYDKGYYDGKLDGYDEGYYDKEAEINSTNQGFNGVWTIISNAFASVFNVFDIQLFGAFKLFHLLAIPLIISVLYFVIKILAK